MATTRSTSCARRSPPGRVRRRDPQRVVSLSVRRQRWLVLAAILVFAFFYVASRSRSLVPGRLQFAGEGAYAFVRNGLGRDIIGSHDFMRFVPYLFALFFFILLNNFFGSIPFIQFPTFSRAGMAYALAGLSWVVYNYVGMRKHGPIGYLKLQTVPSGVSPVMYPLLIPLEFFSNILVRPVTLALRLFCNMFAGHILLVLFSAGGLYQRIPLLLKCGNLLERRRHRVRQTARCGRGNSVRARVFHQRGFAGIEDNRGSHVCSDRHSRAAPAPTKKRDRKNLRERVLRNISGCLLQHLRWVF